jgi:predicted Zn-dependent peptidase
MTSGGVAAPATVSDVMTSQLSNGIKVVSKETGAGAATVGVSVKAGSRFASQGEASLLKHLAFKGSASRSDIKLARDVEAVGVSVDCVANRDSILYSATGMRQEALSTGLEAVAETALTPKFNDWHVTEMKFEAMDVEVESATTDPAALLSEKIHEAAFGKNAPMGRATLKASPTGAAEVSDFHGSHFNTANMTVVGSGVGHADLVAAAEAAFGSARSGEAAASDKADFVGGFAYSETPSKDSYVAVAFNGPALGAPDYADSLVLQEIWKQGAAQFGGCAFNHPYQDTGLIGVAAGCSSSADLTEAIVKLLKAPISDAAVATAKVAVKTQVALSAECAASLLPMLANGGLPNVDKVNAASVKALAAKLTKSAPALATLGPDDGVPPYNTFAKMF